MDVPAAAAPDKYASARSLMVDGQIRPNKVSDPRILAAMRRIPRERFLPADLAPLAYVDDDVPLGNGRALIEPLVIARLIQLAAPTARDSVLVVAAGAGYGAALIAACAGSVTALEEDESLIGLARRTLPALAPSVRLVVGPLAQGWGEAAPYDIILIEGAVRDIPPALRPQLRPGTGRLVTVQAGRGQSGAAVIAEATPAGLHAQPVFDCATPVIPSLLAPPGFVF